MDDSNDVAQPRARVRQLCNELTSRSPLLAVIADPPAPTTSMHPKSLGFRFCLYGIVAFVHLPLFRLFRRTHRSRSGLALWIRLPLPPR